MHPANLLQRVLLFALAAVLVLPPAFCILHRFPPGVLPPVLEYSVERVATVHLSGVTIEKQRAPFSKKNWWNGTFQHGVEDWYRENFGFRRPALRLYNQFLFDVFRSSSDRGIIIGRHDVLYNLGYTEDACGLGSPMPQSKIEKLASDLAAVQQNFERMNKPFIVLITPSKSVTSPDDIPHRFCPNGTSGSDDYRRLLPLLEKAGVPFVDGQAITSAQKAVSGAPLFPRGGLHWGDLPKYRVTDALIAEINRSRSGHMLNPLKIHSEQVDIYPRNAEECDLLELLNLAHPNYASPYLHIEVEPTLEPGGSSKLTLVGGSFARGVVDFLVSARVFDEVSLLYYYILDREVWLPGKEPVKYPIDSSRGFAKDLLATDVVVLEINVPNIHGNHIRKFLDDAFVYFSESGPHRN